MSREMLKLSEHDFCFVIFGASGDLAVRMLIPSLETISCYNSFSDNTQIIGVARTAFKPNELETKLITGITQFSRLDSQQSDGMCEIPTHFLRRVKYIQGDYDDPKTYASLRNEVMKQKFEGCLIYLATPPTIIDQIAKGIARSGLRSTDTMWVRLIVEKPFGRDVESGIALNNELHKCLNEDQIYRIDHYLAKETVTNIFTFRWGNTIWEPLWNRNYISHVEIIVAEEVGVGQRIGYYDQASVIRDMIQNHLLQMLAITAMEPPSVFNSKEIRDEKMKVLHAIRPLTPEDVILGQYHGYRQHKGVPEGSTTPTLAYIRFYIDNWRWQGVPFYVTSGKCMVKKESIIKMVFRQVPHSIFGAETYSKPNVLKIRIQPLEGIILKQHVKVPGPGLTTTQIPLNFAYSDKFGPNALQGAYERVILDAIKGDQSFFTRADEIEQSWRIVAPLLSETHFVIPYAPGICIGRGTHDRNRVSHARKNCFPTVAELVQGTAEIITQIISETIKEKGICRIAISGGQTPKPIFSLLGTSEYLSRIDVSKLKIFFVDERCVAPDQPESNYRMAKESLLEFIGISDENVFRMKGEDEDVQKAALEYAETIQKEFGEGVEPEFDLILLGMGPDGHTASLFPGLPAIHDKTSLVIGHFVPQLNMNRITIGPRVIRHAKNTLFIISDKKKVEAYNLVKHGPYCPAVLPAQIVRTSEGEVIWNVLI
ncbi:glucose-6-phosphate 1-dehydrogenase family protein [Tritrichomonas foetus]|uniref:Glucose-6-phosphate 1-dehydrogenase n=1 Tax=Tritrichomonas foetus TaxID=1144522 RepID=A0A1J4JLM9_9EUKA|nr:glucose-6-phosphate 1-dehydrogenase family protein [Tritrichomonas foetus]|eukprot:OHT00007.1 glucose-6-phosphate 1-dehydrogenase family protein [Tritrichomonas foetus]